MHSRLASAEYNLSPGEECPVGEDGMDPEVAQRLLNAGYAELVRGTLETATMPDPDEDATGPRVEQSGSWYTIYDADGQQVDKVQGEEARDAVLEELEG